MENRNFPNPFRMLMDQGLDRNHLPAEQSYNHIGGVVAPENGSLVYPLDSSFSGAVHYASQRNPESRANEHRYSSFRMEARHFQPAFSGPSYGPLPQTLSTGNLYLAPENIVDHARSNHYQGFTINENEHGQIDSVTGSGGRPLKRKSPSNSVAFESGSTSRFHGAGSSSSAPELLPVKPTSDIQNIPSGHIGLPHYGGGNLSIAGEDSLRNVRRRSRLDLEPNPMYSHLPSYSSHHYHSTTHPPNYHSVVDLANMNADRTPQQWHFNAPPPAAHGMTRTSGTNGLTHESHQLLVRGSGTGIVGSHSNSVSSRSLASSSRYLHTPHIPGAREGRSDHPHRATLSYRAGMHYSQLGHEATSAENGLQSLPETYSSRYARPSARGWRNGHRNGRSRIAVERFQLVSRMVDPDDRIGSEDIMMMDHSSLYASSRNLFDQHRGMRLDIDNMGYEELLALEERIGIVSTGVPEEMISKCVTGTFYSVDRYREEASCAICLEEYAKEEGVGTINKCGHNYHASCIRKWLLMNNACPICKSPALADCSKQE